MRIDKDDDEGRERLVRYCARPLVTPKPPPGAAVRRKKTKACKPCSEQDEQSRRDPENPAPPLPPPSASPSTTAIPPLTPAAASQIHDDPTTITIKHWRRILDGALYAASSRLDWATLLQRTHGIDALMCPACDGRLTAVATVTDPLLVRDILTRLGVRADPLPRARARDPTGQESFDFEAAS